jgi:predicted nucleic acid-binding protein
MLLLDTNILIEAERTGGEALRRWIDEELRSVSAASLVEVFRYQKLNVDERKRFDALFASLQVLPVSADVVKKAEELRKQRKMSIGDAIIAATALVNDHRLVTRNLKDFAGISGLTVLNPLELPST